MKKISEFLQAEDTCGNLYHFSYDEPEENANHDTMEEVLNRRSCSREPGSGRHWHRRSRSLELVEYARRMGHRRHHGKC